MRKALFLTLVPLLLAEGCSKPKEVPREPLRHPGSTLEAKVRLDEIHCYQSGISPEYRALLDTISWAEGADYDTLYGGKTFADLSRHPSIEVTKWGHTSTAAGRYQIVKRTARMLKEKGLLQSMEPDEQDKAAIYLFEQKGINQRMIEDAIVLGDFAEVWDRLAPIWASFPTSTNPGGKYGQAHIPARELKQQFYLFYAEERKNPCEKNVY